MTGLDSPQAEHTTTRVIIDTDVGGDPDDALALALALSSPEIVLEGITTVHGDTHERAALASRLLRLGGREGVRVLAGVERSLLWNRKLWGAGAYDPDASTTPRDSAEATHAVDFFVDTITRSPGEITLVAIGPLTNVAAAIIREPAIVRYVKEIILMGGVTRLGPGGADLPLTEHNIRCDPEAASLVFRSGAPITMLGLDVTLKALLTPEHRRRIGQQRTPLSDALIAIVDAWLEHIGSDSTPMHDPLAVSLLLDRSLVQTRRMEVEVMYDYRDPSGMTVPTPTEDGNVQVALDVDAARFMDLLLDRIAPVDGVAGNGVVK